MYQPIVLIAGYAASGKTTLASKLAQNLKVSFLDVGSVVRQTAIDIIQNNQIPPEQIHAFLSNQEYLQQAVAPVSFEVSCTAQQVGVLINQRALDTNNPNLRQPFLDTETLSLASLLQPQLTQLQQEVALLSPIVVSARNSLAYSEKDAIRIFIDPGMTTRVRRRAQFEKPDIQFTDWPPADRRDLVERIIAKEWRSIILGVSLSTEQIDAQNFYRFFNKEDIATSLQNLTREILNISGERGWRFFPIEGRHTQYKER